MIYINCKNTKKH